MELGRNGVTYLARCEVITCLEERYHVEFVYDVTPAGDYRRRAMRICVLTTRVLRRLAVLP